MLGGAVEPGSPVRTLASYDGSLFAGTGAYDREPKVWRWIGTDWVLLKNFRDGEWYINQDSVWSLASTNGRLYAGLMGQGGSSPIFVYDGKRWNKIKSIPGCQYAKLAVIDNRLWVGTNSGRVFCLEDSDWKEKPIKQPYGILSLAQYNNFVYAGTYGEGRIYRLPYPR